MKVKIKKIYAVAVWKWEIDEEVRKCLKFADGQLDSNKEMNLLIHVLGVWYLQNAF